MSNEKNLKRSKEKELNTEEGKQKQRSETNIIQQIIEKTVKYKKRRKINQRGK
jgi:hypothetical protein